VLKELRLLWQARRLQKAVEREVKMGWDPRIAIMKALKAFGAHAFSVCAAALLLSLDEARISAIIGDAFPPQVALVLVPLVMALVRYLGNAAKHKPIAPLVIVALLLPGSVSAQAPAPEPVASPTLSAGALEVDLAGWTQAIVTRGEKREIAGGRVVVDYALSEKLRVFSRIDITGAQDFGTIEAFGQYQSFRAVETFGGLRYHAAGVAVAAVGGTSWSIEGQDGPLDPRMATALLLVRVPLPGGGHAYVGGGHRGPVGGAALVASITYPAGPTRLIVDYDLPLTTLDGLPRPGVLKTGVAIPIRRWVIR
jgi:hypothetical protein